MSRFSYDGDWEPYPNAWALWERTVRNALHGRKGRAVLAELRAALLALPAPRVAEGYGMTEEGEVCALGALALHRHRQGRFLPAADEESLRGRLEAVDSEGESRALGTQMGIGAALAFGIALENDDGGPHRETPEERHARILRWIDRLLEK